MIPGVVGDLGCYHLVSVSRHFVKEYGVDNREEQLGVYPGPDEEEIENMFLGDERERHWRMVFEENNGEVC